MPLDEQQVTQLNSKIFELEAKNELLGHQNSTLMERNARLREENEFYKEGSFLDEYQQWVESKASDEGDKRMHSLLGLMDETGEIASAVKKEVYYGIPQKRTNGGVFEEAGDLMFYLVWLCTEHNFKLSDAIKHNIEKLNTRYKDGFTKDEAVERRDKK